ncbi:MAG: hypothetical protein E7231_01550 [Cellulosilyticum sp.]|jgi:hypothetical protein|nr:hypothetical protein [Cellulosilyticum sp.]
MTRGYVCITKGKNEIVNVAYLSSDAYLSWYGLQILKAIENATVNHGINAWVENQRNKNIACNGNDNDCKNFALNWIKPDRMSRSIDDWTYAEYGYIYDSSNYYLKVYHYGKLLLTVDTDNLEEINKYLYLFEKETEIYRAISYDEDLLDDVIDFSKAIKIAAKEDLSALKQHVADYERLERIYLDDTHCIAPGHRNDRQVYQKRLSSTSSDNTLKFIIEHDCSEYYNNGWQVLIQTPFVRIPIAIAGKSRFSSEKALMKNLRLFVKENANKLFRLACIMDMYIAQYKDNGDIKGLFLDKLDTAWDEQPWFVYQGYMTKDWFKREASRHVA